MSNVNESNQAQLMAAHQAYMLQVENDCPEWFSKYEDLLNLDAASAFRLAMTAPSEYTAGLLMGRALELSASAQIASAESV